ncbi:MAG TPA: ABC transporter permease [Pyrinomonadaceae bacterium]|nr:ABC transporter permease [Pyrinomonadaceae bacterium]
MKSPARSAFGPIFWNEVLVNSKRGAPYALMILFSGAAVMGWARGPAVTLGWATNSDFYIARGLKAFSFLFGLPIFNAVIMGDSVIRDFRLGIDPLLFSKPLNRAHYLLGKFFGNFFVLVCCAATFPLTQFALQAFRPSRMIVQPIQVVPYFKHFFFFVVITHVALAAFYFAVGALTRNSKIVFGLAACFYPIYAAYGLFLLSPLSIRWRSFFDIFLLGSGPSNNGFGNSADYLNQYIYSYTPDMIWNRVLLILVAGICLAWLYLRFKTADQSLKKTSPAAVSLGPPATKHIYYDTESLYETRRAEDEKVVLSEPIKTKSPSRTAFGAIFWNEVLLNSKRVAPYVVAALCAGNAVLWWGWGPATGQGLAVNSDLFIGGVLSPYSFLFLPLYTAVFMADPAIRDFRTGIDPLIFSAPVTRVEYLLGKFFGNFFVLVCCQAAFVLTLFVLQWVPKHGVTTLHETKFLAYPKHFLVFVAVSHMFLAAVYFTVGALTRNVKIVYGLGIAFYPIYISYQTILLNSLPWRWKLALDPLVMNRGLGNDSGEAFGPHLIRRHVPKLLNQFVIVYDTDLIINRVVMILLTAICLTILYRLFTTAERSGKAEHFSALNLSTASEGVYYPESAPAMLTGGFQAHHRQTREISARVVPDVARVNEGVRANVNKLIAALVVEFRLLRAERSLVVMMPLAVFLSILEVTFYNIPPDVSYSAAYATNTARLMLLFLIGMAVFYTGEAMHRDREVRIEPVLWAAPVSNNVLLLSKFLAVLSLAISLIVLVGLAAISIQLLRGHTPVDVSSYLMVYSVILLPSIVFMTGTALMLNVLLRDKYVVYALSIGTGVGLVYFYSQGHNHWLYNPVLYNLWTYSDLAGPGLARILSYRAYCLALGAIFLLVAHLGFQRKAKGRSKSVICN